MDNNDSGKEFTEKYFKGPLNYQINGVLDYIKNNIIEERVVKLPHTEKALRAFNYPYAALEEIIANAVYHKSYELRDPIEIQIFPDKITVLSYPSPMPPVNHKDFATQKRIVARKYRNRRIGDFLKPGFDEKLTFRLK